MRQTLASLILLIAAVPLWAQIDLPAEHQLGKRIVATSQAEAKAYSWHCETADLLTEGGTAFIWAREGRHSLTLVTVDEDYTIKRFEEVFEVSDQAPPTPATLRDLVSDSDANLIAEFYRDFAANIQFVTPSNFWPVHDAKFPVKGNSKLDNALRARLEPAVLKATGLSIELLAIADEFAKPSPVPPKPPVPPVVEGTRQVVIAYASEDSHPELDGVIVQLRKPGTPAQSFLANSGHTLDALDDETIRDSKWSPLLGSKLSNLPKLFIIDPQTNAILFEQTIADGTTADNITERIRETGG